MEHMPDEGCSGITSMEQMPWDQLVPHRPNRIHVVASEICSAHVAGQAGLYHKKEGFRLVNHMSVLEGHTLTLPRPLNMNSNPTVRPNPDRVIECQIGPRS